MLDYLFAYAAGLLTLINPCVLPLLPLIGAGAVSRHPAGPLAMAAGMGVSFTIAGLLIYSVTRAVGWQQEDISVATGWLMIGFGLVLLVPRAQLGFARLAGNVAGGATQMSQAVEQRGLWGETLAGGLLGLAWSPCIGPTLGAAIGFAAQGENLLHAALIMVLFSAGAATVMLGLSYGARSLIQRRRDLLQSLSAHAARFLGVALVTVGVLLVFHLDRVIEGWFVQTLPAWFVDLSVSI